MKRLNRVMAQEELPLQERTDEELMLAVARVHDKAAFTLLEHRHDRPLHAYLRGQLGSVHASEDVYQDTWVKVYTKANQFASDRKFRPWLYTIATNTVYDLHRRTKNKRALSLDQLHGEQDGDLLSLMDLMVDDLAAPPDILMMQEERQRVRECIAGIPAQQREAIMMVRYEGLKYREAAQKLGVPIGTVKSRINQGKKRLAAVLGIDITDDPGNQ